MKTLRRKIWVTLEELSAAKRKVRNELKKMGLLVNGSRLDEVECLHERATVEGLEGILGYLGFYHPFELDGDGVFTAEGDGNIHIPALFPEILHGERQLPDVLRHEYGHALADRYRDFFQGEVFKDAFGAKYHSGLALRRCKKSGEYVTGYAMTNKQEDFAETFMFYMKHKGKLPACFHGKKQIEKKWKAIAKIVKGVAKEVARRAKLKPAKRGVALRRARCFRRGRTGGAH